MLEGINGVQFDNGVIGETFQKQFVAHYFEREGGFAKEALSISFACHLGSTNFPMNPRLDGGLKASLYTSQAKNDPFSLSKEGAMLCKRVVHLSSAKECPVHIC